MPEPEGHSHELRQGCEPWAIQQHCTPALQAWSHTGVTGNLPLLVFCEACRARLSALQRGGPSESSVQDRQGCW